LHRTFVNFDDEELKIIRRFQKVLRKAGVRDPSVAGVVRGMIRDYRRMIEVRADPDFLKSYWESRKPPYKNPNKSGS
jgi:hypothetical protein